MQGAARTTTDGGLAGRARAFDAGVFVRGAERVVEVDGATVLSTPSLPTVPHMNTILVHGPLDGDAVEALAELHHGGLPHRRAVVDDEDVSARLAAELEPRGWSVQQLVLMGRDGAAPPPVAGALAEEVPYGHVRGLRDEWVRAEPWAVGDDDVTAAHAADARLFAATPTRAFAVFDSGAPVAYALLLSGERDGMVEDVYTTPAARGRGLAAAAVAAVLHAARAEGHEAVFVPTAREGGAEPLYARLGFARLAVQHHFSRRAA